MDLLDRDSTVDAQPAIRVRCQQCGEDVSPQFARVFGDNENVVHGCLECSTARELCSGDGGRSG